MFTTPVTKTSVLEEFIVCYHMALWQRDFKTGKRALQGIDSMKPGNYFTEAHSNWFDKARALLDRVELPENRELKRHTKNTSRSSKQYFEFRLAVLERDNWKCTECEATQYLHVHHIIRYRHNENKRLDVDNGITLCIDCHKKEHKANGK